jgi:hypothetical protein
MGRIFDSSFDEDQRPISELEWQLVPFAEATGDQSVMII